MFAAALLLLVVFAVVAVAVIGIYNRLVGLRNGAASAWSDIAVQLKRRHDLVGNLVETVKGYATHERSTLDDVIAARNRAAGAAETGEPAATGQAEGLLTRQLRSLFALAESYPDLKASQNFSELQGSLETLETELQSARRYYNAVVRDLNTRIQSFPDVLIARSFGFRERDYFELDDPSEAEVPEVKF
jgi:LemA protein